LVWTTLRRKTSGVGRIAARVIEQLVAHPPLTMRSLIDDTRRADASVGPGQVDRIRRLDA
jgi:hypothetical protein